MQLWRYDCPIEQLGKRYTLIRPLGSGGMADVCLAWDEHDHHEVAVKVIKPDVLDPSVLQRFLHEGKVVAALDHPHIIRIYGDCVCEEILPNLDQTSKNGYKVPYIVMENLKGGDLKKRLVPGQTRPLVEIVRILRQLCSAVQYAHDRGVIHRDIKPANILFREHPVDGDQVVLSDFGLALVADDTHYSLAFAGTPAYMALEQWHGKPEFASDIFSLGVVLYQLCTGQLPSALQPPEKPSLLNPSLPSELDDVVLRALSSDPSQRFARADLFWKAIQDAVRDTPLPRVTQAYLVPNRPSNGALPVVSSPSSVVLLPVSAPSIPVISMPLAPISPQPIAMPPPSATPSPEDERQPNSVPSRPSVSAKSPLHGQAVMTVALVVLTLLLLVGLAISPDSGVVANVTQILKGNSPVTITIIPTSKLVQGIYRIQGVTGNANPNNRQVTVRQLTSEQTDTKEVPLARSAKGYLYLNPADVTRSTKETEGILKTNAQNDITKKQIKPGEQLLGKINCDSPKTMPDVELNVPQPNNVTVAYVTVSLNCNAKVFDANAVQTIALKVFQEQASKDLEAGYVLAPNIVTEIQPQTQQDGTIPISVTVWGVSYYQWTKANQQTLLHTIKGKNRAQAQAILNNYLGIGNAKINPNIDSNALPSDPTQINLEVKVPNNSPSGGVSRSQLVWATI